MVSFGYNGLRKEWRVEDFSLYAMAPLGLWSMKKRELP